MTDDVISKQEVLRLQYEVELEDGQRFMMIDPDDVENLTPISKEPKTGHWIRWYEEIKRSKCTEYIPHCKCSECNTEVEPHISQFMKYCYKCGAKMIEPQESEDKE